MKITDTSNNMLSAFNGECFEIEKWAEYIDDAVPGAKDLCVKDMNECIAEGFSWEKDYLPILNAVYSQEQKRKKTIDSFHAITDQLNEKIIERFGKKLDTNLVLYLGLCNGAGWVTRINNETTVLLGIEKIIELGWNDINSMNGLIIHELGHVYQEQYGVLDRQFDNLPDQFLWQLFTEGIAMVFEQEVVGNSDYYHQYDDNWKKWCYKNVDHIKRSFYDDLRSMTYDNQRYFGDWVSFEGHGDTGYYLGAHFVRFMLEKDSFDNLISYDIKQVKREFDLFLK